MFTAQPRTKFLTVPLTGLNRLTRQQPRNIASEMLQGKIHDMHIVANPPTGVTLDFSTINAEYSMRTADKDDVDWRRIVVDAVINPTRLDHSWFLQVGKTQTAIVG